MKLDVNFHCDDCEIDNHNKPFGTYDKDTEFFNLTQAVEHLREHPNHHVDAFAILDDNMVLVETKIVTKEVKPHDPNHSMGQ